MWRLFVVLCLSFFSIASAEDEFGDVIFVQILFRHGQRTPTATYPTDPYGNASFWPVSLGQLTNQGKLDQYHLGKWIRSRYAELQPFTYSEKDIYIRSSDVDRTLMSAYANLAGLYEPTEDNWSPDIKWQPIPVHTVANKNDFLILGSKVCARYQYLRNQLKKRCTPNFLKEHEGIIKLIEENAGVKIKDIDSMSRVTSVLLAQDLYGYELPEWTKEVYPEPLLDIFVQNMQAYGKTTEMNKLLSGSFIEELLNHFRSKINGSLTQTMWIYSAHDTTLSNLMSGLKIHNGRIPTYCSTMLLELRQKEDDYFVTIYYKNSTDAEPFLLQVPGCEVLCPFDKLVELTRDVIPDNLHKLCHMNSPVAEEIDCPF